MKYLLLLIATMLFLLPCDAKYKVTWEEETDILDADTTSTTGWPFRKVTKSKCFDKPIEAQDFKKGLPINSMAVYSLSDDCPIDEGDIDLQGFVFDDSDTTGN